MACVVYFIELIELNVISSISLSTTSIFLDKRNNLHFADVSLVADAGYFNATNGDILTGMVYEIGIFIMEVLCGTTEKHTLDALNQLEYPQWVQNLIDPRLNIDYHTGEACTLLTLGLMCTNPNEDARPTIWSVRNMLISLTADMQRKLTRSQPQLQFSALHFFKYNEASEYTCQEVRDMTSNFSTPKGYGNYLGTLSNGEKVLVDQLHPSSASPKEFINQVKMYTRLPTWGLVMNPIGFCVEEGERILIYRDVETMPPQVYLRDNAKVFLFETKLHSIVLQIARGLNSLCNLDIVLHNTTFDNIHVTRNGYVMLGLQFEEENSLTKFEKLSKQMDNFGAILGQLVYGPKWQSRFAILMHLKNMAVDMDPGFPNFMIAQLADIASLCLEEGYPGLSMVNVVALLEGIMDENFYLECLGGC